MMYINNIAMILTLIVTLGMLPEVHCRGGRGGRSRSSSSRFSSYRSSYRSGSYYSSFSYGSGGSGSNGTFITILSCGAFVVLLIGVFFYYYNKCMKRQDTSSAVPVGANSAKLIAGPVIRTGSAELQPLHPTPAPDPTEKPGTALGDYSLYPNPNQAPPAAMDQQPAAGSGAATSGLAGYSIYPSQAANPALPPPLPPSYETAAAL